MSLLACILSSGAHTAIAQDAGAASGKKTEVEIQLTESFYRALNADDTKSYSTHRSDEYLRQIAVASKFMVETNLKVLENQRRIIELLTSMQQ